jgi:hypothetical protein
MYSLVFVIGLLMTESALTHREQADAALAALADPEKKAKLISQPGLEGPLKKPNTVHRLESLRDHYQVEADLRRSMLFRPQKMMLIEFEEHAPQTKERVAGYPESVREAIVWAGSAENTPRGKSSSPWGIGITPMLAFLLVIPASLVLGSVLLRGGISLMLAGIALVRSDGFRASRRQCGMRTALVWLPIVLLLYGSTVLQIFAPEMVYFAALLWLLALALLPVYIVIAIRFPTRALQDRLAGTYLVPA